MACPSCSEDGRCLEGLDGWLSPPVGIVSILMLNLWLLSSGCVLSVHSSSRTERRGRGKGVEQASSSEHGIIR